MEKSSDALRSKMFLDYLDNLSKKKVLNRDEVKVCLFAFSRKKAYSKFKDTRVFPKIVEAIAVDISSKDPKIMLINVIQFVYCAFIWKGDENPWKPNLKDVAFKALEYISNVLPTTPPAILFSQLDEKLRRIPLEQNLSSLIAKTHSPSSAIHTELVKSVTKYLQENFAQLHTEVVSYIFIRTLECGCLNRTLLDTTHWYFLHVDKTYCGRSFFDIFHGLYQSIPQDKHPQLFDRARVIIQDLLARSKKVDVVHCLKAINVAKLFLHRELRNSISQAISDFDFTTVSVETGLQLVSEAIDCELHDERLVTRLFLSLMKRLAATSHKNIIAILEFIIQNKVVLSSDDSLAFMTYFGLNFNRFTTIELITILNLAPKIFNSEEMSTLIMYAQMRHSEFSVEDLQALAERFPDLGSLPRVFHYSFISQLGSSMRPEHVELSMQKLTYDQCRRLLLCYTNLNRQLPKHFFTCFAKRILENSDETYSVEMILDLVVAMRHHNLKIDELFGRVLLTSPPEFCKSLSLQCRLILLQELELYYLATRRSDLIEEMRSRLDLLPEDHGVVLEIKALLPPAVCAQNR